MMYYPKSQIKTNLYTKRDEYALSTTKELYRGYYYETSSGQKFTGKTPQDGPNIPLIPYVPEGFNYTDRALTPSDKITTFTSTEYDKSSPVRDLPLSNPTLPTSKDQSLGVFTRYFCKKNNELKYMEIDQTTYTKLFTQEKTIAWDLYTPIKTLWYIKGDKEKIFKANKGLISLIEQQDRWYGFTQWFQDKFLKYYLES